MRDPWGSHDWELVCLNLPGFGDTLDWLAVWYIAAEQVVENRYAAVEDKGGDLGSTAAEGVGGVAAVVQDRYSAVGLDNIHWPWEVGSRFAAAAPGIPFV